jgi:short-subunit dehydrogenase
MLAPGRSFWYKVGMRLRGRTAIVTGASSGIGRCTAEILARRGVRVGLVARRADLLDDVASAITGAGGEALALPCDVTDPAQVRSTCARAIESFGRIDFLVNNAGYGVYLPVQDTPMEVVTGQMDVNYLGAVRLIKEILPHMIENGSGHIVNVASAAGHASVPSLAAYSGSKFAIVGFTEGLYHDVRKHGIRVSIVSPGPVRTAFVKEPTFSAMPPIGWLMTRPERVASVVSGCLRWGWYQRTTPWYVALAVRFRQWFPAIARWITGAIARPR